MEKLGGGEVRDGPDAWCTMVGEGRYTPVYTPPGGLYAVCSQAPHSIDWGMRCACLWAKLGDTQTRSI